MVDITLLGECEHFVGSKSSFFTRSAIRQMMAHDWEKVGLVLFKSPSWLVVGV